MRWVGIDEAGYGPNLGPMVMSAVVAETVDANRPDLWGDPPGLWSRAGGASDRLWLDDSKALYRGGMGLDRLEAATLITLSAAGLVETLPVTLAEVLSWVGGCTLEDVELSRWLEGRDPNPLPSPGCSERVAGWLASRPAGEAPWRIVGARSVVLGPESFNAGLGASGRKSRVHASAFARLLRWAWDGRVEGQATCVRVDKHGGRHCYADLLAGCVPEADAWIHSEGPALSRYELTGAGSRFLVEFAPRADADDGLVALASILSKTLREHWMSAFNGFWTRRIPGLRPTAGYPTDARRFREAIEPLCGSLGLGCHLWWREK
jgi:hypothetical protein